MQTGIMSLTALTAALFEIKPLPVQSLIVSREEAEAEHNRSKDLSPASSSSSIAVTRFSMAEHRRTALHSQRSHQSQRRVAILRQLSSLLTLESHGVASVSDSSETSLFRLVSVLSESARRLSQLFAPGASALDDFESPAALAVATVVSNESCLACHMLGRLILCSTGSGGSAVRDSAVAVLLQLSRAHAPSFPSSAPGATDSIVTFFSHVSIAAMSALHVAASECAEASALAERMPQLTPTALLPALQLHLRADSGPVARGTILELIALSTLNKIDVAVLPLLLRFAADDPDARCRESSLAALRRLVEHVSVDMNANQNALLDGETSGKDLSHIPLEKTFDVALAALSDDNRAVRTQAIELAVNLCQLQELQKKQIYGALSHEDGSSAKTSSPALFRPISVECFRHFSIIISADIEKDLREIACKALSRLPVQSLTGSGGISSELLRSSDVLQAFHKKLIDPVRNADAAAWDLQLAPEGDARLESTQNSELQRATAAGALVHGLEDEFEQVRTAAVQAASTLALAAIDADAEAARVALSIGLFSRTAAAGSSVTASSGKSRLTTARSAGGSDYGVSQAHISHQLGDELLNALETDQEKQGDQGGLSMISAQEEPRDRRTGSRKRKQAEDATPTAALAIGASTAAMARAAAEQITSAIGDEIESVRLTALRLLGELCDRAGLALTESHLAVLLCSLDESSGSVRSATRCLLRQVRLGGTRCLYAAVEALVANQSDRPDDAGDVLRTLAAVGGRHHRLVSLALPRLLNWQPQFAPVEPRSEDPHHVAVMALVCAAAARSVSMRRALLPPYTARHWSLYRLQYPDIFPEVPSDLLGGANNADNDHTRTVDHRRLHELLRMFDDARASGGGAPDQRRRARQRRLIDVQRGLNSLLRLGHYQGACSACSLLIQGALIAFSCRNQILHSGTHPAGSSTLPASDETVNEDAGVFAGHRDAHLLDQLMHELINTHESLPPIFVSLSQELLLVADMCVLLAECLVDAQGGERGAVRRGVSKKRYNFEQRLATMLATLPAEKDKEDMSDFVSSQSPFMTHVNERLLEFSNTGKSSARGVDSASLATILLHLLDPSAEIRPLSPGPLFAENLESVVQIRRIQSFFLHPLISATEQVIPSAAALPSSRADFDLLEADRFQFISQSIASSFLPPAEVLAAMAASKEERKRRLEEDEASMHPFLAQKRSQSTSARDRARSLLTRLASPPGSLDDPLSVNLSLPQRLSCAGYLSGIHLRPGPGQIFLSAEPLLACRQKRHHQARERGRISGTKSVNSEAVSDLLILHSNDLPSSLENEWKELLGHTRLVPYDEVKDKESSPFFIPNDISQSSLSSGLVGATVSSSNVSVSTGTTTAAGSGAATPLKSTETVDETVAHVFPGAPTGIICDPLLFLPEFQIMPLRDCLWHWRATVHFAFGHDSARLRRFLEQAAAAAAAANTTSAISHVKSDGIGSSGNSNVPSDNNKQFGEMKHTSGEFTSEPSATSSSSSSTSSSKSGPPALILLRLSVCYASSIDEELITLSSIDFFFKQSG